MNKEIIWVHFKHFQKMPWVGSQMNPPLQHKKRQLVGQKTRGVDTKVAITFASLVRIQIFLVILKALFKVVILAVSDQHFDFSGSARTPLKLLVTPQNVPGVHPPTTPEGWADYLT